MASRSLNKVILIGNLTRDPELRYTPNGTAVCTVGLATNRRWTTQTGEIKEDTEFHRIVAWNKLAELCGQLLQKGRKVYVEGRLSTHTWMTPEGTQRIITEIVIEDMILLDSKRVIKEEVVLPEQPIEAIGETPSLSPEEVVSPPVDSSTTKAIEGKGEDLLTTKVKAETTSPPKKTKEKKEEGKPPLAEKVTYEEIPF